MMQHYTISSDPNRTPLKAEIIAIILCLNKKLCQPFKYDFCLYGWRALSTTRMIFFLVARRLVFVRKALPVGAPR